MRKLAYLIMAMSMSCNPISKECITIPSYQVLYEMALAESQISIHPGIPGESPFWNTYAHRFIYAPSFDFPELETADSYRYVVISEQRDHPLIFTSDFPWEPLSPVWESVPTGDVRLVVEGLKEGVVVDTVGERRFYRAAPYHGPYHAVSIEYRESAERLFRYLFHAPYIQYWLEHHEPDPDYGLYSYPSKMYAAVISGMLTFSTLTADPIEKETALQIATMVADNLIAISEPEGSPLEYFPPTYTGPIYADMVNEWRGESLADRMMLIYPASVGQVYLDLFDHTADWKYYNAAVNIAETYKNIQLENGTWYLLVFLEDGEPVAGNYVVPTGVISFLNRLSAQCGCSEYSALSERALSWIEENLAKDFNWEGQFEDQKPSESYRNLSKGQAVDYALHLLESAGNDSMMIRSAVELIRFAEDQFVIWEDPEQGDYWGIESKDWMTPCVLEQYNFYTPVNTSSASMIDAFRKAYDKTGNILYLAKAIDLANSIVYAQNSETGHYPTYLVSNLLQQEGWINCMVFTARAIMELGEYLNSISYTN
jgi:hypothetical protein